MTNKRLAALAAIVTLGLGSTAPAFAATKMTHKMTHKQAMHKMAMHKMAMHKKAMHKMAK